MQQAVREGQAVESSTIRVIPLGLQHRPGLVNVGRRLVAAWSAASERQETTLPYTGQPPLIRVADADAAAYAQREAALCNNVCSAG